MSASFGYATVQSRAYASFWRRLCANLIDNLLMHFVATFAVAAMQYYIFADEPLTSTAVRLWSNGLEALMTFTYFVAFEGAVGATPGKMLLSLRVLSMDGGPIGFGQALVRNLCKVVSVLIFFIGYLMVFWTARKQALHDIAADCIVIRTQKQ